VSLTPEERRLARLTVAIVHGDWDRLRAIRAEWPAPDRALREAWLQSHLFAGFPRAIEAAGVLARAGGLGVPEGDEPAHAPDDFGAGAALFDTIYADHSAEVRRTLEAFHPLLERFVLGHAYGRVLSRGGLTARTRELLACAALTALDQPHQLLAHLRGARRTGASAGELEELLAALSGDLASEVLERARGLLSRVGVGDGPG